MSTSPYPPLGWCSPAGTRDGMSAGYVVAFEAAVEIVGDGQVEFANRQSNSPYTMQSLGAGRLLPSGLNMQELPKYRLKF